MLKKFLGSLFLFMLIPTLCFGGIALNGDADLITCGNVNTPDTEVTVAVWVNLTTLDRGSYFTKSYGPHSPYFSYGIWANKSRTPAWVVGVTGFNSVGAGYALTDGNWFLLVGRYSSGVDQNIRIYDTDGVLQADASAGTAPTGSIQYSAEGLLLGAERGGSGNYLGFGASDAGVWSSYLTDAEVDIIAKSKVKGIFLQISPSTLAAYYRFDEFADGTALNTDADGYKDLSGNGFNCQGIDGDGDSLNTSEKVLTYP